MKAADCTGFTMEDRRAVVPILREEAISNQTGYVGWVIWRNGEVVTKPGGEEERKERIRGGALLRLEFSRFFSHLAVLQPVQSVRSVR